MKIGDLVTLSSKGSSLKGNQCFLKGIGIVVQIYQGKYYDLGIKWFCEGRDAHNRIAWFKRYEIKKLKPPKSQTVKKCP
jgi:hypothetical protein|tara:strand:+ start:599 stop:835 length:237 start_codon:yes stop_codon:yes gene_type:complete